MPYFVTHTDKYILFYHSCADSHLYSVPYHYTICTYLSLPVYIIRQYGCTLLHWAVQRSHLNICELLISAGADLSIVDNSGKKAAELVRDCSISEEQQKLEDFFKRVEEERTEVTKTFKRAHVDMEGDHDEGDDDDDGDERWGRKR